MTPTLPQTRRSRTCRPWPKRGRAARYPATLAQQRFWLLDKLEPGNSALNVAVRWRIEGDLSVDLIEKAFVHIVERHETLRTSLIEIDGEPFQLVQREVSLRVPRIDLTALPEADAFAECDHIARAEATTPFNLAIAPLIRMTHVRVRPDIAIVLVTAHHAVCDGWSIGLLAREMGDACAALQAGRRPHLPNLPITYGEYTVLAKGCGFGRRARSGGRILVARARRHRVFRVAVRFPARNGARIRRGDPIATLGPRSYGQAGSGRAPKWQHAVHAGVLRSCDVLHRHTGATDIAVGTQVAGRDPVEIGKSRWPVHQHACAAGRPVRGTRHLRRSWTGRAALLWGP